MGTHRAGFRDAIDSTDIAFFRAHGHAQTPLLVQWILTTSCSLSCPHCSAADAQPRHASRGLAARLLDQVAAMAVPQLLLTGGEPLEHPEFPWLLGEISRRSIPWSLNTAALPGPDARAAIERHPPTFVAVSIDGPAEVHDPFRGRAGALDDAVLAIRWFRQCGVEAVAAGTTVTSFNVSHLDETFALVVGSGATSWGLHLTVPEGRAARGRSLALTASQARSLLRFVARRRAVFPVNMADEIGFCGGWEPFLRDSPFFCGAGRTHCVVLPDGEVVPCTTLDRGTSAGNVMDRPLTELWREGFGALRAWVPTGACAQCEHATACSGGCWLQRRHGRHCHRPAWEDRSLPLVAVCVGLAACANPAPPSPAASAPTPAVVVSASPPPPASFSPAPLPVPSASAAAVPFDDTIYGTRCPQSMDPIDWAFLRHAVGSPLALCSPRAADTFRLAGATLLSDPLAVYFTALSQPSCAPSLQDRISTLRLSLQTTRRSLGFVATVWRDLQEWALDGPDPQQRSHQERELLRTELLSLGRRAEAWRAESLARHLDGFLHRDESWRHAMVSKAGPPPGMLLLEEVATRRWGAAPARYKLAKSYLDQHPVGESLRIPISVSSTNTLVIASPTGERRVRTSDQVGIFDVVTLPATASAPVTLTLRVGTSDVRIGIPPGAELAYLDLSRAAILADRARMEAELATGGGGTLPDTFLIPLLRERVSQGESGRKASMARRLSAAWLF